MMTSIWNFRRGTRVNLTQLLVIPLFSAAAPLAAGEATTPLRPATITWGGVSNNEQIAGSEALWPFVQKHMDAFLMHGAYWLFATDEANAKSLASLGQILQKHGKTAHLETGCGEMDSYDPSIPAKRNPYRRAHSDIAKIREFSEKHGVRVSKVRVDWFPMTAMGVYAKYYNTTNMRQLMAMVTGAREFGAPADGFDMKNAHWVEYGRELQTAFPKMEIAFDQAPCNHGPVFDPEVRKIVPWEAFGYGYKRQLKARNGSPVLVNDKQLEINFDFADQVFGVMSASKDNDINCIGFEGDTPFNYFHADNPRFPGDTLIQYLLKIERTLQARGIWSARIINDSGKEYNSDKGWVQVDLGTAQEVDKVRVVWGAGFGASAILSLSADGKTWAGASRRLEAPINGVSECKFKPQLARFIKIELRKRGTPQGYQISEVELFGPAQPALNLALQKRATASSIKPGHPADGRKGGMIEMTDGDPETLWESFCLNNDEWDQRYHDRTMEYLEFYQGAGGRADEYIAESWYDGPFTLFPETKPGTFTNLARNLIRRIKGINTDGSLMPLDLAVRPENGKWLGEGLRQPAAEGVQIIKVKSGSDGQAVFDLRIRNVAKAQNPGDARATPLLRASTGGMAGWTIKATTPEGAEVTDQLFARKGSDGWFVGGLEPGQDRTLRLSFSPQEKDKSGAMRVSFDLYWNPQETSPKVRDSVILLLGG